MRIPEPQPPESEGTCPECGEDSLYKDMRERALACLDCGHVLSAYDWDRG